MLHNNTMNQLRLVLGSLIFATLFASSCSKPTDNSATAQYVGTWTGTTSCGQGLGGWVSKSAFPGNGRKGSMNFTVTTSDNNTVIYLGGGEAHKDFWGYDAKTNSWTRLADLPVTYHYRDHAIGFAIDDFGYMTGGADSGLYYNDFWKYNPYTNSWGTAAAFPGKPRIKAFSFVSNGVGYVGGGLDTGGVALTDVWAYYPGSDTWVQRQAAPRSMVQPFAFNINGHGYLSCGKQNGVEDTATFVFDSVSNSWSRVAGFPGHSRTAGAAFVLNNIGYCGLGNGTNTLQFGDFFSYNPTNNKWNKLGDFVGNYDAAPMAGVAYNKGYVGVGGNVDSSYYKFWYEFTPQSNTASFTITPGPNNFSVNMKYIIGKDTCQREVTLTGSVSSIVAGQEAFSIGTNNVVDKCGKNYAVTGSGALNSNGQINITIVSSSSDGTSACTFIGIKQ
jgi:hypothetical protein